MSTKSKKNLSTQQQKSLLDILKNRFEGRMERHPGLVWKDVEKKLLSQPDKLWSLQEMERTGGEPDVMLLDKKNAAITFVDGVIESPAGRRSLCYDREALDARKESKPLGDALSMAKEMGIGILTETQYRALQQLGKFDLKTSSWILTPEIIRKLDGALFCDRRYNSVFVYHNGASSYYSARGFRGIMEI